MNQLKSFFWSILLLLPLSLYSQDEILMTIDGKTVTRSEFERIYHKNNALQNPTDNKGVNDYLELFINFKLKVIEAQHQGLDTLQSFKTELGGYRDQLAKSYLRDTSFDEKLILEAYDRFHTDLNVSHILVRCSQDATPADTLAAFTKINQIRQRIVKGEKFEAVARSASEDPNVKENGGTLGWITAFFMPYSFENTAYSLNIAELSKPVRTQYGYHLIMVNERRPSRGEIRVAHIFKAVPPKSSPAVIEAARKAIFAISDSLKNGIDFALLAKNNSEDRYSASQGGELPWFGTGRMIPEFENAAFGIKNNGEYTAPVHSSYGWHIIKKLDQRGVQPLSQMRSTIKNQMNYSQRNLVSRTNWINKLKADYGFSENSGMLNPFLNKIDSSFTSAPDKADIRAFSGLNATMFTIGKKAYTQADFFKYITTKGKIKKNVSPGLFVHTLYKEFSEEAVLAYEKSMLDVKYPEFGYLMQEYHDGILLFDLTDEMVWSKAVKDTAGLLEFYTANEKKYQWNERVEATLYLCKDTATARQAMKLAGKKSKKPITANWLAKQVCPMDSTLSCIKSEEGKFEKGENPVIDESGWETGITGLYASAGKVVFAVKHGKLQPTQKTLQEARGLVTADYQDYLEKLWIKELRAKYTIDVDKSVLAKVK
jgi:peptidyl-prolyl cis-trans isomerase SurA